MNNMKLELKHLSPYLPYGLKLNTLENEMYLIDYKNKKIESTFRGHLINIYEWDEIQPILSPMSDIESSHSRFLEEMQGLGQTIEYHNGSFYDGNASFDDAEWLPYCCFEILLRENFDVFGLITAGLAIDINTL